VDSSRTRPKLNLQPRSKPVDSAGGEKEAAERPESKDEAAAIPAASPATATSTNIFGAARPVDTAAREREIEERLAKSAEIRAKDERYVKYAPGPSYPSIPRPFNYVICPTGTEDYCNAWALCDSTIACHAIISTRAPFFFFRDGEKRGASREGAWGRRNGVSASLFVAQTCTGTKVSNESGPLN
jgi:hypothetical protein